MDVEKSEKKKDKKDMKGILFQGIEELTKQPMIKERRGHHRRGGSLSNSSGRRDPKLISHPRFQVRHFKPAILWRQ
ncbi:hypothetical protein E2C01_043326 [Portunus trituberculatus]|uniref:Uncharacterized protein n=1 Tax=Portunus trituberculatus TaxID=210409 RepID=A0A5B7FZ96_PORTR|nr:hypothetical protein [Portunus trituberculatus]